MIPAAAKTPKLRPRGCPCVLSKFYHNIANAVNIAMAERARRPITIAQIKSKTDLLSFRHVSEPCRGIILI